MFFNIVVEEYDINENEYYAVCKECPENSYPSENLSMCIYCTGDTKPALVKGKYQCSCYNNILVVSFIFFFPFLYIKKYFFLKIEKLIYL